jgi:hypothetical protein
MTLLVPKDNDAVDFDLEQFTPSGSDAVNFTFTDNSYKIEWEWDQFREQSSVSHGDSILKQGYSYGGLPNIFDGLVGWWPLHDDSARDYSGNGHHGTVNGATAGVAGTQGVRAMDFDGSNGYVQLISISNLSQYSVSLWVKYDSTGGNMYAFRARNNNDFSLGQDSGQFRIFQDGDIYGGSVNTGEWYHLVSTYDGDVVSLYVNGELLQSDSGLSNTASNNQNPAIGARGGGDALTDGSISDVRLYNRGLSPQEIAHLYEQGTADAASPTTDGLVAHWKFNGDLVDSSGTNDLTQNSGTFVDDSIRGKSYNAAVNDYATDSDWSNSPQQSLFIWLKPLWGNGGYATIVFTDGSKGSSWDLSIDGGPPAIWNIKDSNGNSASHTYDSTPEGIWCLYGWTYDGSVVEFIKNGTVVGTDNSLTGDLANTSNPLRLGGGSGMFERGHVKVDEARIYDRALNQWEISELYRYGTRGRDLREQLVRA